MKLALSIIAGVVLTAVTAATSKGIDGYCGQQWPRLFAASLCGHLSSVGGPVVGRSNGATVRGSNRAMQAGGLASPSWTELGTDQPGSWQHSDGHTYVVIEGVQEERHQNNWWTNADAIDTCSNATCAREASNWGPGGFAMRINFTASGGQARISSNGGSLAVGDWYTACAYAWVESGTLPVRIRAQIGVSPNQVTANNDVTLTTIPTEHCVHLQDTNPLSSTDTMTAIMEDPVGDGTGVDFLVGYMSGIWGGITSTPIKNNNAITPNGNHVQREADVLLFSTVDLSVESGEGQVDVAWLDFAYDWPATPAVHTVVSLAKPGEVRDDAGTYTGTINGAPVFDDGGLDMNGTDEWVETPDTAALDTGTGDFSAEAWFRVDDTGGWSPWMSKTLNSGTTPGWYVAWVPPGSDFVKFEVYGSLATLRTVSTPTAAYTDGNWHHVMVVRDRTGDGKLHLYLDGTEPAAAISDGGATENLDNGQPFRAGSLGAQYHDGAIKKVKYYVGTAKTLADALVSYNAGHASGFIAPSDATLAWSMVPTDCRVYYDRSDASTNRFAYTCGGPTAWQTTTFDRGDVSRLTWRRAMGVPLELCIDGACANSTETYIAPSKFDTNGCWGCDDPDGAPTNFLNGGLREARLR